MPFSIFVQMDGLPVCLRSDIGENLPARSTFWKVKEKKGFALCIIQKIAGFCEAPVKKPQKKSLPCLLEEFPL